MDATQHTPLAVGTLSTYHETTLNTDQYELESLLSDRFVLTWRHMSVVGLVCVLFVLLSFTPLTSHTTWLFAARGEAILHDGQLPTNDVTQSLSQGMTYRETSWLSSVFWAIVARQSLEAISWATTLLASISLVLLSINLWQATRNSLLTGLGVLWFALFIWSSLGLGSSQVLILPLWIGLIILSLRGSSNASLLQSGITIALVTLWANLDATVFVGIALLAVVWLGNSASTLLQNNFHWNSLFQDRNFRFAAVTLELCVLATLLTPLGIGLWTEVFQAWSLQSVSLDITSITGLCWVVAIILLGVILRKHQGPLPIAEVLTVSIFGLITLPLAAQVVWFAPLAVLTLIPRAQAALGIASDPAPVPVEASDESNTKPPVLRFAYTLGAVLLCWIAFAISPLSQAVLGGQARTIGELFDDATPVAATRYLRENPVDGLVFAPATWGDLLQSQQGGRVDVYATTSMAYLPQQAKFDYNKLNRGEVTWSKIADRYAINTFVIDKKNQSTLLESVRENHDHWQIAFEDDLSLILRRSGK
ncbi:hypothetical protein C5Y96_18545 [Blastopirellula marina]|uniref:Glycosyltransferase RgtA/B/C/D-like domain-containing protein n=1 Tax=Blastopirellula marina TaxID=124 RepID=A0A2S8F5V1_9BACT|nr:MULTISPECIES: hypothetical protein [Pirellulaceae]PQO27531.1 hypothetical protein C5Y96_18545 [Blastopirellula marina]RCS48068.1 hypothetical protein DTL36_18570 [Bremerella cremea]